MINSRSLSDLKPKVAALASEFINRCKAEGIDVIITSTYRDAECQDKLYAQGRTLPGKRVTNAKAGQSFHNWHVAFDFCPIVNGKPIWNDEAVFTKCGEIGESLGLTWAGRWTGTMKEMSHLQYTNGLTLAEFQEGKTF